MNELRKTIRDARDKIKGLRRVLNEKGIKIFIDFDDLENAFVFLNGYLACMEKTEQGKEALSMLD